MASEVIVTLTPELVAIITVKIESGERHTLTVVPMPDRVPMPRRWLAQALRELADRLEAIADEVEHGQG